MATHYSILFWEIPWTGYSPQGRKRVGHDFATKQQLHERSEVIFPILLSAKSPSMGYRPRAKKKDTFRLTI